MDSSTNWFLALKFWALAVLKFFDVVLKFEPPNARVLNFPKNSVLSLIRLVLINGDCVYEEIRHSFIYNTYQSHLFSRSPVFRDGSGHVCQQITKVWFRFFFFFITTSFARTVLTWIRSRLFIIEWVQLNEYETAPNFIQLNQNLTSDCLLI